MSIKVQFIYRRPSIHFFSIEKVFGSISKVLQNKISVNSIDMPRYSSSLINIMRNMVFARKGKADIFHVTGDVHYVVLLLPAKKTILTIHDIVFTRTNKGIKAMFFKWIFLKLPVKKCKYLTTISEQSKEDIIRYTGCDPGKVTVIPNPVNSFIYFKETKFSSAIPTLLFVGSTPNKNLNRLIHSIAGMSCMLEIVGRIPDEELSLLKKYHIQFRQYKQLTDSEIADRYAACDLVVFVSLYEGFGLPILEGQKAGRPVLTSNISPMKEVAGEGACLVDPENIESIKWGIRKITEDDHYRNYLVEKGFDNLKKYDVQKIANQYLNLYEKIAGKDLCAV